MEMGIIARLASPLIQMSAAVVQMYMQQYIYALELLAINGFIRRRLLPLPAIVVPMHELLPPH